MTGRRVFAVVVLLVLAAVALPAGAPAAQGGAACSPQTPPDDQLASAAFGLTRQELDALYGPGNAAQTGWIYTFDGFDLTLVDCDLILTIDPNGKFADPEAATDLVRTLLPEDAVLSGTWQFGTLKSPPQDADEWVSAALAARYRQMGTPRTGAILVLYTYAGDAMSPGAIDHIELRSALIPT
jgi:hypothetical protein